MDVARVRPAVCISTKKTAAGKGLANIARHVIQRIPIFRMFVQLI
jgi:hypothetical protein